MENARLLDTPEQQAEWIREVLCRQAEVLAEAGFSDIAFMVVGQGIETMGAFLDKKPFRAPGQSRDRFDRALAELFPPRYTELNGRGFLYRNLRSSLTHLSVGSPHLVLSPDGKEGRHLSIKDKKTLLVLPDLLTDYTTAWEKVIDLLTDGSLRIKPLASSPK